MNDFQVIQVENNDSNVIQMVTDLHYAGRRPSISFAFLILKNNTPFGAITYGKPASNTLCIGVCGEEYSPLVYELNRVITKQRAPKNLISWAIAKTEKLLKQQGEFIIVSYSDTGMNHSGYIYQASNFLFTGTTKERTDKYVPKGKHSRHYKNSDETVHLRRVRTSKHRYVKFIGDKKFKRKMRKKLKYPVLPFPKGDNGHGYELGVKMKTKIINRLTNEEFME